MYDLEGMKSCCFGVYDGMSIYMHTCIYKYENMKLLYVCMYVLCMYACISVNLYRIFFVYIHT